MKLTNRATKHKMHLSKHLLWLGGLLVVAMHAGAQSLTPTAFFDDQPGLTNADSFLLSPDNRFAYTLSGLEENVVITVFSVDASTGSLNAIDSQMINCGRSPQLSGSGELLFFRCTRDSIGLVQIDTVTGNLTLVDDRLIDTQFNEFIFGYSISADSQQLYVTGVDATGQPEDFFIYLDVYQVPRDASELARIQRITRSARFNLFGTVYASPDGRSVYVFNSGNQFAPTTIQFQRNAAGQLSEISEAQFGLSSDDQPIFSGDGRSIYVNAARFSEPASLQFIARFSREPGTGDLTLQQMDLDTALNPLPFQTLVFADDERLMFSADSTLRVYRLSAVDGQYTLLGDAVSNDFINPPPRFFNSLQVTNDGSRLYANAFSGIALFNINGLPFQQAAPVPVLNIPALLVLMTLLLFIGGFSVFRLRHD